MPDVFEYTTKFPTLSEDCTSGLPLLRIMDKLWPGCVDWKRANARPRNVHERVENCNYALEIAQAQGMKVVGIGGKDIADGSTKLTLAILWQLMRADVMKFLSSMGMTERDIVRWANQRVGSIGSSLRIERCGDDSVCTGVFLLQLLRAVAPDCVDEALVYGGGTQQECKLNAKYGISCAQKMGCRVFLTWEDIVQAKPKMVLTLLAAAMQQDMLRRNLGRSEVLNELQHFKETEQAVARASVSRGKSKGGASPGRKVAGKGLASPGRGRTHSKLMEEDADRGVSSGGFLGGLRSSMGFGSNSKAGKATGKAKTPRTMALKEVTVGGLQGGGGRAPGSAGSDGRASYSTNL